MKLKIKFKNFLRMIKKTPQIAIGSFIGAVIPTLFLEYKITNWFIGFLIGVTFCYILYYFIIYRRSNVNSGN